MTKPIDDILLPLWQYNEDKTLAGIAKAKDDLLHLIEEAAPEKKYGNSIDIKSGPTKKLRTGTIVKASLVPQFRGYNQALTDYTNNIRKLFQ